MVPVSDVHSRRLISEFPKDGIKCLEKLQSHCANVTFADKSRYDITFLQVTHKGADPCAARGQGAWRPRRNMLRPRRNVPKCKDGVGEMALAPLAVMVAREYSLLCMNYGNA